MSISLFRTNIDMNSRVNIYQIYRAYRLVFLYAHFN